MKETSNSRKKLRLRTEGGNPQIMMREDCISDVNLMMHRWTENLGGKHSGIILSQIERC